MTKEEEWELELAKRRTGGPLSHDAFDHLMRNSVNILQGPDDPLIDDMTAYTRLNVAKYRKARQSHVLERRVSTWKQ